MSLHRSSNDQYAIPFSLIGIEFDFTHVSNSASVANSILKSCSPRLQINKSTMSHGSSCIEFVTSNPVLPTFVGFNVLFKACVCIELLLPSHWFSEVKEFVPA